MRFEELNLTRYGHFTDFAFSFPKTHGIEVNENKTTEKPIDFHILYGPNEAGKSTTLEAITDLLYGFERLTQQNYLHSNELLEIDAVLVQDLNVARIKRFKNRLTDLQNNRLDGFPLDLQGLSRKEYESRFAFNELSLQEGGDSMLSSKGDLGEALFSASSGISNLSRRLETAMRPSNAFWEPGRRTKIQLVELKKQLQENKKRLNEFRLDAKALKSRYELLTHCETELERSIKIKNELSRAITRLENDRVIHKLVLPWIRSRNLADSLIVDGAIVESFVEAIDLSSESAVVSTLETIRNNVQNDIKAETEKKRLLLDIESTKHKLETVKLSVEEANLLASKNSIESLSSTQSAADEWQNQISEHGYNIELYDSQILEFSSNLNIDPSSAENLIPGELALDSLHTLLNDENELSIKIEEAKKEIQQLEEAKPDLTQTLRDELEIMSLEFGIDSSDINTLKLPDEKWLFDSLEDWRKSIQSHKNIVDKIRDAETDLSNLAHQIRELTSTGLLEPEDISSAIHKRDDIWRDHKNAINLQADYSDLADTAELFEKQMQSSDNSMTFALEQKEQYAQIRLLRLRSHKLKTDIDSLKDIAKANATDIRSQEKILNKSIDSFHTQASIHTESIRSSYSKILELRKASNTLHSQISVLKNANDECISQAHGLIETIKPIIDPTLLSQLVNLDLADLTHQVSIFLEHERRNILQNQHAISLQATYEKDVKRREEQLSLLQQERSLWQESWQTETAGTLFQSLEIKKARSFITTARKLQSTLVKRNSITLFFNQLQRKKEERKDQIDDLLRAHGKSSLSELELALTTISERNRVNDELSRGLTILSANLDTLEADYKDNTQTLDDISEKLSASGREELIAVLERTARHRAVIERSQENWDRIIELSDKQINEEEIISWAADFDISNVDEQLDELTRRRDQAESQYEQCLSEHVLAEQSVNEVGHDGLYASLVQERENLLLEIEQGAKSTAIARAGGIVLKAAIQKFRVNNQSSILQDAQRAFNTLTLGRYPRLLPREDSSGNEKLYAIDVNEKSRSVQDLSTGTRYQLYLALRAAAHSDYARKRTPLPFVADDIMESFDDELRAYGQ